MNNMEQITGGIYLVRTQAGFKKAMKEWSFDGSYTVTLIFDNFQKEGRQ